MEARETETRDDERTEAGQTAVGQHGEEYKGQDKPSLEVHQRMPHLIRLPLVVLDAHHVGSDTLHSNHLLLVRKEAGGVRRLRHEENPAESGQNTGQAKHEENVHPRLEGGVCDMSKTVTHEGRNDGEDALHTGPEHGPKHLLLAGVEEGRVHDEAGSNNRLGDA